MNIFFDILRAQEAEANKPYHGMYACAFYVQASKNEAVEQLLIELRGLFDDSSIGAFENDRMYTHRPYNSTSLGLVTAASDAILLMKWLVKSTSYHMISRDVASSITHLCESDRSFIPFAFKAIQANRFHCLSIRDMMLSIKDGLSLESRFKDRVFDLSSELLDGLSIELIQEMKPGDWPSDAIDGLMDSLEGYERAYELQNAASLKYIPYLATKINSLQAEGARIRASVALHFISHKGILIDERAVHELRARLIPKLHRLEGQLVEAGFAYYKNDSKATDGRGFSLIHKDNKAIQSYLSTNPNAARTKNGNLEMSADALSKSGHAALEEYATFKDSHIIKTYLPFLSKALQAPDHVVHPNFSHYSETGRVNGRDPNLLNLPREGGVRECFIARKGFSFVFADYDGAEMRTFAQALLDIVGHSRLADKYKDDSEFDPHSYLVAEFMGLAYRDVIERKSKNDKNIKQMRQLMKAANFGFLGGLSSNNFGSYARERYGVMDITSTKALELYSFYMRVFPEVRPYFNWIKNQTMNPDGAMDVVLPRSLRISGGKHFTQACNCFAQGVAADGALNALYSITEKCFDQSSVLYASRPILFIHDEIITEVPSDRAEAASIEIKRLMELGMQQYTPDVPSSCSVSIADKWAEDK